MKHLLIVIGSFLLTWSWPAYAQLPDLYFEQITTSDGLSNNAITCLYEDQRGFLWIGTRLGLNRYDGKKFEHHLRSSDGSNSISGNYIVRILQDTTGVFWVATKDGGLNRYDEQAPPGEQWMAFQEGDDPAENLPTNRIIELGALNDSVLVLSLENHCPVLFNTYTNNLRYVDFPKETDSGRVSWDYRSASEIPLHPFWIHRVRDNESETYFSSLRPSYICRIDKEDNTSFLSFADLPSITIADFLPDGDSLWAVGWKGGLFVQRGLADADHPNPKIYQVADPDDKLNCLAFLNNRLLVAGLESKGLMVFDRFTHQYKVVTAMSGDENSLTGNRVLCMLRDKNGILWVGTTKGLSKYDPDVWIYNEMTLPYNGEESITHYNLIEEPDGTVWIATSVGMFMKPNGIEAFRHLPLLWKGYNLQVTGLLKTGDDYYLSSETGLFRFDPERGKVLPWIPQHIQGPDGWYANNVHYSKPAFQIRSMETTTINEKPILLFSVLGYGMMLYDIEGDSLFLFSSYRKQPHSGGLLLGLKKDADGEVWLGTTHGLYRWKKEKGLKDEFEEFIYSPDDPKTLPGNYITSIIPGSPGTGIWVTTPDGLGHIVNGQCQRYLPSNGLHRVLLGGLQIDRKVWTATLTGFEVFDTSSGRFSYHPIPREIWYPSAPFPFIQMQDGSLAFSSGKSFIRFREQDLADKHNFPKVYIDRIMLNNSFWHTGQNVYEHRLKYNENFLDFYLSSPQLQYPQTIQAQYRLKGLHTDWQDVDLSGPLRFTNLPVGDYSLEIRATNPAGAWSDNELLFQFSIRPPWFTTWWFYLAALTIAFALVRFVIWIRERETGRLHAIRNRIANDLHDDVGSALSTINVYSEIAGRQSQPEQTELRGILEKISSASQEMQENMSHIVWSLQPRNDELKRLSLRMKHLAAEMLTPAGIGFTFNEDPQIGKLKLSPVQRKESFLILKEALHNTLKYADCSHVSVRLYKHKKSVCLEISDNGKGFDPMTVKPGNGLLSMRSRSKVLHGNLNIQSSEGNGTTVLLCFPI